MALARRKFLKSSLVFGASALLVWGNTSSAFSRTFLDDGKLPDEVLNDPLYRFTRETFEPYVGGYFQAPNDRGEMVALKLIKVEAYAPKAETEITRTPANTESFSLQFTAEAALPRVKSIHQIKHGALGDFSLFLTRRDVNDQISYEAVFNHLR